MKRVLVLGAGMVSGPCVRHLLEDAGIEITLADLDRGRAESVAGGHPRVRAVAMDARRVTAETMAGCDVVVSLLPADLNPGLADLCTATGTHLIAPSTVGSGAGMEALDRAARDAGVLVLAEIGLDPGIDHMLAARTIDAVHAAGGTVTGFFSWCGGLPAPEANTNPLDYKFSWYPEGALLASTRPAAYLRDGQRTEVDGPELLAHYSLKEIEGVGWFEEYPNGDSTRYLAEYGIPEARNIYRATLRYVGWCETALALVRLGLVDETALDPRPGTFRELTARATGCPGGADLRKHLEGHLSLPPHAAVLRRVEWLGLLGDEPVPPEARTVGGALRMLLSERLSYAEGERDMVVMRHEFEAEYPDSRRERLSSTLVDYGSRVGDTAMARGTGLPPAVAARLVMDGEIDSIGACLPVESGIYGPVLEGLRASGYSVSSEEGGGPGGA